MSIAGVVGGVAGFAIDLAGMLVDRARRLVAWLGKPGSLLKLLCGFLAFCSLTAGIAAYSAEQRARELGSRIVVITNECSSAKEMLQRDVNDRDERLAKVAENLRAEAAKLAALRHEAAVALGAMEAKQIEVRQQAEKWRLRYEKRPNECQAALEVLDVACAGQEGY